MDRHSGKRGSGAVSPAKKERSLDLKSPASKGKSSTLFFNITGCKGRVKSGQDTRTGSSDRSKSSLYFHSSKGKEIIENSHRCSSVMIKLKSSNLDSKRKLPSPLEFEQSESSVSGESEASDVMSLRSISPTKYQLEPANTPVKVTASEIGSSSASSNIKPRKAFQHKKQWSREQNFLPGSTFSSVSESTKLWPCLCDDGKRYGLRNSKCSNMSDTTTRNCGENVMKKKTPEEVNSLDRQGRKVTTALCINGKTTPSTSGIAISDSRRTAFASREYNSSVTSARGQRLMNANTGMRLSCQHNQRHNLSRAGTEVRFSRFIDTEIHCNVGSGSSSSNASSSTSSYSSSGNNGDNPSCMMPCISPEFDNLMDRETWRYYNMDGIVEVLLAIERFGQDEELTNEQVLAFETRLFLSGLNLYDEHRDMRMDVDNMSYEELLALEERMGVVSTALSEEELSKCLRRSIFQASPSEILTTQSGVDRDDIKCSICLEDYECGDEIGKLVECQHGYHLTCIDQWLRLKNWCPICKSSAAPSHPSSSL